MSPRNRHNGEGSIYEQRPGLWAAYVWVDRPDGTKDRQYVYGKDRDVVHAKWVKLQQQATLGPVASKVPTVGSFMARWLDEVIKPNREPLTYATYETFTRLYITPGLGTKRLDRLQTRDVQTWINKVAQGCQCCAQGKDARRVSDKQRCCALKKCCEQRLSARSVSDVRATLRAALSDAVTDDLIAKNVATGVKLPPVRRRSRKGKGKSWNSEEARQLLESARTDHASMYAAFVLILVLGLRKGEMLGLAWEDVDWDGWDAPCDQHSEEFCDQCRSCHDISLTVEWQLQRVGRALIRKRTKTEASDDTLPLPDICAAALKQRYDRQRTEREKAGTAWQGFGQDADLVFTSRYGTPIDPRGFNRIWDTRCAKAGIRKITVHDARRTCGTLLADLDVHPRVAMQILRHAEFSITMEIYTQVSSKATREALKKLGESLG